MIGKVNFLLPEELWESIEADIVREMFKSARVSDNCSIYCGFKKG